MLRLRVRTRSIAAALALAGPLLAWLLPQTGAAEIYRWRDAQGREHFTQRLDQVPPEHRSAAVAAARAAAARTESDPIQTYSTPAAAPPASRGAAGPRGEAHIPFVPVGTLMRVDVRLNDLLDAPFLIDTGASGIAVPREVVDALGIRIPSDAPRVRVTTANGVVTEPLITLDSVQLGPVRVEGLQATVSHAMRIGLLGGTFFNNFVYRVDAAENVITLAPNEQIRGGMRAQDWRERFQRARDRLARLEAHLESGAVQREGERERLEQRRAEMQAELDQLEDEANRLDVPYAWRR